MTDLTAALSKADSNLDESLERLCELVRIKSISTDPAYALECRTAAQWLVDRLNELAFQPAFAIRQAIRWLLPITMDRRARHTCFFMAIMTSSRSIRSPCGQAIPRAGNKGGLTGPQGNLRARYQRRQGTVDDLCGGLPCL